ncbi:MAG: ABC transporter permease [Clostridiaceae bacterium]|nr:ABC transporter permease [Clostridiaceae bacterium]
MRNTFLIALRDLKDLVKDYKRFMMFLCIPIIVIVLMGVGFRYLFEGGIYVDSFDIAVVNQDTHPLSNMLIEQVTNDENLKSLLNIELLEDEVEAESKVRQDIAVAAVILPQGFIHSLETGTNHSVKLITNLNHPLKSHIIRSIMDSYMKSVSGGQSAVNAVWNYYHATDMTYEVQREKIDWVINDITLRAYFARNNVFEKRTIQGINSLSPLTFYLASITIILIMFSSLAGARTMADEEGNKISNRLHLAGVRRQQYVVGKFLGVFMTAILQSLVLLIAAAYFIVGGLQREFFYILLLYMTVIFCVSSLSILTAVVIKSKESMDIIGSTVIFLMALIGGAILPYIYLPNWMQYLTKFTINYWSLDGLLKILDNRIMEGVFSAGLLLMVGILILALASILYNRKEGWGNR